MSSEYYQTKTLTKIREFVQKNDRIPVKRELGIACMPARKGFGSWNKAIETAGFKPNPVLFAKKQVANDGHICDSIAEMLIDNWLHSKGIKHKRSVPYPNQKSLNADFVVDDIWIEYFGLYGDFKKYDKNVCKKRKLARKYKLNSIEIHPRHLYPKNKLDEILNTLLKTNPMTNPPQYAKIKTVKNAYIN